MRSSIYGLILAMVVFLGATVHAAPAAAELSLDRNAVAELVRRSLPEPVEVEFVPVGSLRLRIEGPERLQFEDGGVEAVFTLSADALAWETKLDVRYVPEIDRLRGIVRLAPESVTPRTALPVDFDLSRWCGQVELPRRFGWELELDAGAALEVVGFVHGVEITGERLIIKLGLTVRGAQPAKKPGVVQVSRDGTPRLRVESRLPGSGPAGLGAME